ncbi:MULTISPECIES: tetratricopeptide repeat protein [unclassified Imperialibacter]|uniref:tetratricopeptide repeat-containing sensor histidine kinase n=1 Tax=unclassified Imperialibacter TaxID=2629706 RepID=UPI001255C494|nr:MULTISPECIES: tetratricopeptide repeat protein [unclassified Imperialibacter]CAD5248398.1 conserved hypothetical protein [Imperialibacter sp. 75]CAD5248558.1 conserved hypothetical protein [Imperialibacter sp. 89]VVS97745.1 putative Signal transduction histidine kinase [Imperialibacter sp. EC-SDR9]
MIRSKYLAVVGLLVQSFIVKAIVAPNDLRRDLTEKLRIETDNRKRVDLMNEISYSYFDSNDTIANSYADSAARLSRKIDYQAGLKYAVLLQGIGFYGRAVYDSALFKFSESQKIEDEGSREIDLYASALIGECLTVLAKYDSAEIAFDKMLAKAKSTNSYWLPRAYLGFARISLRKWDNNRALLFLDSARSLIPDSIQDFRNMELLTLYGEAQNNLLKLDESHQAFDQMCSIAESFNDNYFRIKCMLRQADFFYDRGNYPEALENIRDALEITKVYNYPAQQVQILYQAGLIYFQLTDFDLALDYYFKALSLSESIGLDAETANILIEIAWVFKEERKLDLALDFAERSMEINERIGSKYGVAYVHNTQGLIYFLQKKFPEAIGQFRLALALRREINYARGIVATLYNEALVFEELGENERALKQLLQAIELVTPINNALSFSNYYQQIAKLLIKMGRFDEAENFLEKATMMDDRSTSRLSLRASYLLYSQLHEAKGDFKSALTYRKEYEILTDSIFSDKSSAKIAVLQATYNLKQKESEIAALKNQRQMHEDLLLLQNAEIRDQKLQIYVAVFFLAIVSVFVAIMIHLYRKLNHVQKSLALANSQLKEANLTVLEANNTLERKVNDRTSQLRAAYAELDTFFYRSSHDFRRPLTTLMGLADVAKITVKDEQAIELFKMVRVTAENLDKMLYKLQSISDIGAMELSYKNVIVRDLVENCLEKHAQEIKDLCVDVILNVQVEGPITTYPVLVSIIMDNLIENALNFSSRSEPYVKVNAYLKGDSLVIEVEDNGHGIPDDHKMNIFAMYFKATEKSKGNGLGLYIVSKAAEKLSATVHVETAFDKGSRFIVEIPDCVDSEQAVSA